MTRPWSATYPPALEHDIEPDFRSVLDAFRASVACDADATAISYFDGSVSYRELDARSDALAVALSTEGFIAGDRLALYTQNNPAFVVGLLATWKVGGVAVLINPMNRARELSYLLEDSGATVLLTLEDLYGSVARDVVADGGTAVRRVIVTSPFTDQTRDDPRVLPATDVDDVSGAVRLDDLLTQFGGQTPDPTVAEGDAPAVLTYTSGTTGKPKGAINTHAGLAFNSQTYRHWMKLDADDVVLGVAPLFHITGLVGHVCLSLLLGSRLVLAHRFVGPVVLDAIREHRPTFTVAAITALTNLAGLEGAAAADFASLRVVYSGGAPVSPAMHARVLERTGMDVHNIYGMTETTSPTHAVPLDVAAPVDPGTGALSIGVPVFNTVARVVDDDGSTLPIGQIGEIVVSGPQVTPGYWNRPDATAEKIVGGELYTGDVGLMDDGGWFYLVDRKTDMIIASGYKVWPREVEDVLCGHAAVREAAVVGIPDEYRGETVKAFVALEPGADVTAEELIAHCKNQLAAYKYPRILDFVEELPKNLAGKILRRELR